MCGIKRTVEDSQEYAAMLQENWEDSQELCASFTTCLSSHKVLQRRAASYGGGGEDSQECARHHSLCRELYSQE